ncbi:hypothetical protein C6W96_09860 [Streptomyces sp. CS149]|nr:hypothetical protein C6W96_09860 [Streptomyces sp. CS149]
MIIPCASPTDGRRVDVMEFLRRAGLPDEEQALDDFVVHAHSSRGGGPKRRQTTSDRLMLLGSRIPQKPCPVVAGAVPILGSSA